MVRWEIRNHEKVPGRRDILLGYQMHAIIDISNIKAAFN